MIVLNGFSTTEIGVHEITPIICDHSERKVINNERFDKILLAAMKQSNELYLPKLNDAITFKEFVKGNRKGLKLIAHCGKLKKDLKSIVKPNVDVTILGTRR
jgi:16S rRNA (uracil1498-N3)-methyltransferase